MKTNPTVVYEIGSEGKWVNIEGERYSKFIPRPQHTGVLKEKNIQSVTEGDLIIHEGRMTKTGCYLFERVVTIGERGVHERAYLDMNGKIITIPYNDDYNIFYIKQD